MRWGQNLVYIEDNAKEIDQYDLYVGMVFGDKKEAYDAYNLYSLEKGFGIHRGKTNKSKANQRIIQRQFVCNNKVKEE